MGAWIEGINIVQLVGAGVRVAPFMGAWIEGQGCLAAAGSAPSRTLYGCVD